MGVIGEAFVLVRPETTGFLSSVESKLTSETSAFGGVGAALGGAVVIGAVGALAAIGEQFEHVRHQIEQETGATGDAMTSIFDTVKSVAQTVPASFGNITTAVDELYKRGVPLGSELQHLAEQELYLSKITGGDLATTVESTTALMAKFNVPVHEQGRALDVLFKAQQQSGKGMDVLISSLQSGGVSLQAFGFDLSSSAALIAGLEKAGVNVGPALASFRKALGTITADGGDAKKTLSDLIKELTDGKNPTQAMSDAVKLFGKRGGVELAQAIASGKLSVSDMLKVITDGKGGIIATGEATQSLGDKIKLFKNQALVDLEPVGTAIFNVFMEGLDEAGPVLGQLLSAVGGFAAAVAPALLPVGAAFALVFKASLPALSLFADALQGIDHVLGALPAPVIVFAGAVALLAVAYNQAVTWGALAATVTEAFGTAVEFAMGPVGIILVALAGIGLAFRAFESTGKAVAKEADDIGKALFAGGEDAGFFATGITSAEQGLSKYLSAQIKAGKDKTLAQALTDTGTKVSDLAGLFSGPEKAYDDFVRNAAAKGNDLKAANDKVVNSFTGLGKSNLGVGLNQVVIAGAATIRVSEDIVNSLNKEQAAYVTSAQKQLLAVTATGQLTAKQVNNIEWTTRNTDGTINWSRALDTVNKTLEENARKQDATAAAAAGTSAEYRDLVGQLATGTISTDDAAAALGAFGFTADTAKTQVSSLQSEIKKFIDGVQSQLPTTLSVAQTFAQGTQKASSQLTSDLATHTDLMKKLAQEGGAASTSLKDSIVQNNDAIKADYKQLAADSDPQKFVDQLKANAFGVLTFFASVKKLVAEGFGSLAGQLLQLGPVAGGALAAGLASDPSKAAAADGAAKLLDNTTGSLVQFAKEHYPALNLAGSGLGGALGDGVPAGVRGKAAAVAVAVDSLVNGAASPVATSHAKSAGAAIGAALGDGMNAGLESKIITVGNTAVNITNNAAHRMGVAGQISSPSKVTRKIGQYLGDGLALGMADRNEAVAAAAAKHVAAATTGLGNASGPVGAWGGEQPSGAHGPVAPGAHTAVGAGRAIVAAIAEGISESRGVLTRAIEELIKGIASKLTSGGGSSGAGYGGAISAAPTSSTSATLAHSSYDYTHENTKDPTAAEKAAMIAKHNRDLAAGLAYGKAVMDRLYRALHPELAHKATVPPIVVHPGTRGRVPLVGHPSPALRGVGSIGTAPAPPAAPHPTIEQHQQTIHYAPTYYEWSDPQHELTELAWHVRGAATLPTKRKKPSTGSRTP